MVIAGSELRPNGALPVLSLNFYVRESSGFIWKINAFLQK